MIFSSLLFWVQFFNFIYGSHRNTLGLPSLKRLIISEWFVLFKIVKCLYVTLMGHMSWIQMKRPQSLMYHIRKASEMMVQMTTSQG